MCLTVVTNSNRGIVTISKDVHIALKLIALDKKHPVSPFVKNYRYEFTKRGYTKEDTKLQPVDIRIQSLVPGDISPTEAQFFDSKMELGYHLAMFHFSDVKDGYLILDTLTPSPMLDSLRLPVVFRHQDVMFAYKDTIIVKKFRFPTSEELDKFHEVIKLHTLSIDWDVNKRTIEYWKETISTLKLK